MKFESLKSFRTFPGDSFKKLDVSKDTHDIKQYLEKLFWYGDLIVWRIGFFDKKGGWDYENSIGVDQLKRWEA